MIKKIAAIISRMKTLEIVLVIACLGFLSLVPLYILPKDLISPLFKRADIFLSLFILGLSGLPIIIRQEMPWVIYIRGKLAIVIGLMIMMGFWIYILTNYMFW